MRSDFYSLPWAAQQAIRRGERDASVARRRAHSIAELNAIVDELREALDACRALALHCAELDHPIIAQTDRALAKARGDA